MTRTTSFLDRDPLDRLYTPHQNTYVLMEYLKSRLHGVVWEPFCGKGMIAHALLHQQQIDNQKVIQSVICSDLDHRVKKYCGVHTLNWEEQTESFEQKADLNGVDAFAAITSKNPINAFRDSRRRFNWVVSNPPYTFNHAKWLVQQGDLLSENEHDGPNKLSAGDWVSTFLKNFPDVSLAMYMRVTWLEPSEDRALLFKQYPPTDILFLPRNDFVLPSGKKLKGNNCSSAWIVWDRSLNKPSDEAYGLTRNKWYNRNDVENIFKLYS